MKKELSAEFLNYLALCGLSKKKIAQCTPDTRMYHDLDLYGEMAEDFLYVLIDDYQVDMSGLDFDRFFPPEFLSCGFPSLGYPAILPFPMIARKRASYQPLTLAMLDKVMQTKRWNSLTDS